MKKFNVCPAVILLALTVCCRPAAGEDNGERTAVIGHIHGSRQNAHRLDDNVFRDIDAFAGTD